MQAGMSHGCVIGCDNIIHPGWDRSKEIADHESLTVATNVQVYFSDPRRPRAKQRPPSKYISL